MGKTFKDSFLAKDAIHWALKNVSGVEDQPQAVAWLRELKGEGLIVHSSGDTRVAFTAEGFWTASQNQNSTSPILRSSYSPAQHVPSSHTSPASRLSSSLSSHSTTCLKFTSQADLLKIASAMHFDFSLEPSNSLRQSLKIRALTFTATKAIDWLLESLTWVTQRRDAENVGQLMVTKGLIRCSKRAEKRFVDSEDTSWKFGKHVAKDPIDVSWEGVIHVFQAYEQVGISCDPNPTKRKSMEDEHVVIDKFGDLPDSAYFAVYDGHAGRMTVEYVKEHLHKLILEKRSKGEEAKASNNNNVGSTSPRKVFQKFAPWKDVFLEAYQECDQNLISLLKPEKNTSGCTSTTIILEENELYKRSIHVANIGDSKAILVRQGKPLRLTAEHNAKTNHQEVDRIKKSGGYVFGKKVGGQLAVTRAFGDQHLKDCGVLSEPEYKQVVLEQGDTHLIIACDGLWDVVSEEKAVEILLRNDTAQDASDKLLKLALETSTDNVSIVVVKFHPIK